MGIHLGNNCYKIKMSITSKGKGKSGGARIITNLIIENTSIYLIAIYDKSEQVTISNAEILELLKLIP